MLGALIGAGASLIGGLLSSRQSSSNADKTNAHNAQIAAEQNALARENMAQQREFAQSGIRWKVADAQAAGLHPLAALGAQTNSFSNVVGASPYELKTGTTDYSGMGQDIGRAITAGSSNAERQDRMGAAIARTAQVFSLEKMNLENELLKSSIAKERASTPPPIPAGALAHLSRSPNRTMAGSPIDDKKSEQELETPHSTKIARFYGIPLQTPPWHSSGQTWDDILGDDLSAKIINAPPFIGHNLYRGGQSLYEALGNNLMTGSGSRIKRFRRGGGSYRPWAD